MDEQRREQIECRWQDIYRKIAEAERGNPSRLVNYAILVAAVHVTATVPEPSTLVLLIVATAGRCLRRRRAA
jgi:hypothetical protein